LFCVTARLGNNEERQYRTKHIINVSAMEGFHRFLKLIHHTEAAL
jgi:hypothetical protein